MWLVIEWSVQTSLLTTSWGDTLSYVVGHRVVGHRVVGHRVVCTDLLTHHIMREIHCHVVGHRVVCTDLLTHHIMRGYTVISGWS